jgi:uncharacterized protein (TIGR04255 family)
VLQVQRAGFTYSHLPPYSNWVSFRDEAKPLWSRYLAASNIAQISRLAVRVINKIQLPTSVTGLSRYSHLLPQVPRGIPGGPQAFFSQIQLGGEAWAEGARVVVNAGAVSQPDDKVELLLDFDIFVEATKESDSPEIWAVLDRLNVAKDDLFEACVTDATRELIA